MSEFGQNLKEYVKKKIEVISGSAGNLASSTKRKISEYNFTNEKEEIFTNIGNKVYSMWKKGTVFPDDLSEDLEKAAQIDVELERIHWPADTEPETFAAAQQENGKKDEDFPSGNPIPEKRLSETDAAGFNDSEDQKIHVLQAEKKNNIIMNEPESLKDSPLSLAIDDLFERMPPVDKMADRVNSSLDVLDENLKKITGDFNRELDRLTNTMMGNEERDPDRK